MQTGKQQGLPRSSLPLPVEVTTRIIWFANRPFQYHQGPNTGRKDLKNCRLTCKAFNELAAPFLFEPLFISSDLGQIDIVKKVSQLPLLTKGIKTIIYDGSSHTRRCLRWEDYQDEDFYNTHVDDCPDCNTCMLIGDGNGDDPDSFDFKNPESHREGCQEEHIGGHLRLIKKLYGDQDRIRSEGLDYECLKSVIPLLPTLTNIVYADYMWERWSNNASDPPRNRIVPSGSADHDFRGLLNLLRAISETPNHISCLKVRARIHVLRSLSDPTLDCLKSSSKSLSKLRDLELCLDTSDWYYVDGLDDETELHDPPSPESVENEVKDLIKTGALARLIRSTPNLRRLKVHIPKDYSDDDHGPAIGWILNLPLTDYLSESPLPDLELLSLGSFDTTQDELIDFLAGHRGLKQLDLNRITLTSGRWRWVSAVARAVLPFRRLDQYRLVQIDNVSDDDDNPPWSVRKIDGLDPTLARDRFFEPGIHSGLHS